MTEPIPLASGRDADVFVIDAHQVLRRYRDGGDVTPEATIMVYVTEFGFPTPTVYEASGTDLVMERLDGPTMSQALAAGDLDVHAGGALLADLHSRLHALPPRLSADPAHRILHLDLHPDNVMLVARGPVVIDWRNATEGTADLDLALSALILAEVAVHEEPEMAVPAGLVLAAFPNHVDGDPRPLLDRAATIRRHNPTLTEREVGLIDSAVHLLRRPNTASGAGRRQ